MKTKIKTLCYSLSGAACAGALLMGSSASAQNLFVSNYTPGVIDEITPGGTVSPFATGLSYPYGIAFNSAGDLFAGDSVGNGTSYITEITPGGVQSTFASGLYQPAGLAIQGITLPVPEPSTWALLAAGASTLLLRCRRKD
jgi:hypothetical protein